MTFWVPALLLSGVEELSSGYCKSLEDWQSGCPINHYKESDVSITGPLETHLTKTNVWKLINK